MGGSGSGRRNRSGHGKVEAFWSIDVNELNRAGCLREGWHRSWLCKWDSETTGRFDIRTEEQQIHLDYCVRTPGADWTHFVETIGMVRLPCRFGGDRPYFVCPGPSATKPCARRVSKLYAAGEHFLCRHCHQLSYTSQSEDPLMRLGRKAHKALARLDARASGWFDARRPKGMWERSFEFLRRRAFDLEWDAEIEFDRRYIRYGSVSKASTRGK